jgi:hypothetical protein
MSVGKDVYLHFMLKLSQEKIPWNIEAAKLAKLTERLTSLADVYLTHVH